MTNTSRTTDVDILNRILHLLKLNSENNLQAAIIKIKFREQSMIQIVTMDLTLNLP